MSQALNQAQIEDLLIYCNTSPTYWKDNDMLVCCPVHGETHPSMGVSSDKQIVHCFSCGFSGNFAKLLIYSNREEFNFGEEKDFGRAIRKANDFLKDRYSLEYREIGSKTLRVKRFGESRNIVRDDSIKTLPKYKIAPFKSGKETYKYFYDRGFTKADMQKYMIGRDLINKTVTIPVFDENNNLLGVIGRYIDKNRLKNQRYKIYFDFERSKVLYPLNTARPIDNTIILVEGQFDAIRMHNIGYINTLALMTNSLSDTQAEYLFTHCHRVIWVGDNDERGIESREKARAKLKGKVEFCTVEYPSYGKDVCDWSDSDIETMLRGAKSLCFKHIVRK